MLSARGPTLTLRYPEPRDAPTLFALAATGEECREALVGDADAAMYAVKRRGGGEFEVVGAERLETCA